MSPLCLAFLIMLFLHLYFTTHSMHLSINLSVNLQQVGDFGGCRGDPISLKCSVLSEHLAWKCPDGTERVISCLNDPSNIRPVTCQNETTVLHFMQHNCTMTFDQTVITSFVTFNASIDSLTCEDANDVSTNETFAIPFEGEFQ